MNRLMKMKDDVKAEQRQDKQEKDKKKDKKKWFNLI